MLYIFSHMRAESAGFCWRLLVGRFPLLEGRGEGADGFVFAYVHMDRMCVLVFAPVLAWIVGKALWRLYQAYKHSQK